MAAPIVTAIEFDKPAGYAPGDTIKVTVRYKAGTSVKVEHFIGQAVNEVRPDEVGTLDVTFQVETADPTHADGSDSGGRAWIKVSDASGVAVFTATA